MRRALVILVALVAAFISCKTKHAPGELILAIDSDLTPGVDFNELHIDVITPTSRSNIDTIKEFGRRGQPNSFPATFAIVSNGDPTTKVQIRVAAGLSTLPDGHSVVGVPLLLREVTTTIPVDRVALLRIHLEWLCIGYAKQNPAPDTYVEGNCPVDGLTCVGGECVDFALDSSTLPDYDDALVFGGGHSGLGDGTCFDTLGCFSGSQVVQPDATNCTIARPIGDLARVNIALVSARCQGGICDAVGGTCLVPLDTATAAGWTEVGGRIHLPPAACRKASGVVVSTSCPTKTASVPTCGPWSEIKSPGGTFNAPLPDAAVGGDGACIGADGGSD